MAEDFLQPDNTPDPTPITKHIIIVEDDPELADLFRDAFQHQLHWQLTFFSDGQQALRAIPRLPAHLILLDVGLPNLDGAALYKILRGHSSTRHTPIIVITGSHDWQLHRMGLHPGLFLRKPFKLQELFFVMRAHLGETHQSFDGDPTFLASDSAHRHTL